MDFLTVPHITLSNLILITGPALSYLQIHLYVGCHGPFRLIVLESEHQVTPVLHNEATVWTRDCYVTPLPPTTSHRILSMSQPIILRLKKLCINPQFYNVADLMQRLETLDYGIFYFLRLILDTKFRPAVPSPSILSQDWNEI